MKRIFAFLTAATLLVSASFANAAFTAGATQEGKVAALTAALITGNPTLRLALGRQSDNSTVGPQTANYSSFVDLGTGHGYTTGGNILTGCTVVGTPGTFAADFNCTGGLQWVSTDTTGIVADCAVLYNATTGKIWALYSWTPAASATGVDATFTVTPPTVSSSIRGMLYLQ